MCNRYRVAIAGLLLVLSVNLAISAGHYTPQYKGISTPHTVWAKPWCSGKLNALIFVSGIPLGGKPDSEYTKPGFSERDAVELVQRFDIDIDTVMMCSPGSGIPVPGKKSADRLKKLITRRKYKVIVLGNVSFDTLNAEIKSSILKQVKNGAGLICIGFKPEKLFSEKNKLPVPDELIRSAGVWKSPFFHSQNEENAMRKIISAYKLENSKGIWIHYPVKPLALTPFLRYSRENAALYEYWSAWIGKVMLWASENTSAISIIPGQHNRSIILANEGNTDKTVDIDIAYKNILGKFAGTQQGRVIVPKRGETIVMLKIPPLPNGSYYAEVIAKDKKGTVAFGCINFECSNNPKIISADLDKSFVEMGQSINLRVKAQPVENGKLRIELITASARTILRKTYPASEILRDNETALCTLTIARNLHPTSEMRVRVSLIGNGGICDIKDIPLAVTHRNQRGFKFVVWGERTDVLSYYAFKRLAEYAGLRAAVSWIPSPLAPNNISQVAYITKIVPPKKQNGEYLPFSWADDIAIDRFLKNKINDPVWRTARQCGVMVWSLGDEPHTSSVDDSPQWRGAYRNYLKHRYGTIASLNRIWKSHYSNFDAIDVLSPGDLTEKVAKTKKLYARWYDRRYFMSRVFTNIFRRFKPIALSLDPKAKIGFEGAGKLENNPDIEGLVETNDFWVTYNNVAFDIIRGLTGADFICSKWMGYHKDSEHMISYAWDTICRGVDSLWWWRFDGIGKYHGLIKSNLEFWPASEQLMKSLKIMYEGLGDWLTSSRRADDGVAILYSHVSAAASHCENNPSFGTYTAAHKAFVALMRNMGIGYRYITPSRIRNGILKNGKIKVLLLPKAYAIGSHTANAITEFANSGGLVIADIRPGTFDEYCRPRKQSVLKTLFTQQHRKNHAVLLNHTIDDYPRIRGERLRNRFTSLLKRMNIKPITITCSDKTKRGFINIARWKSGDMDIVGLVNASSKPISASIGLDKPYFVSGILPAKKCGKTTTKNITTTIPARESVFFTLSSVPCREPEIIVPSHIERGETSKIVISHLPASETRSLFVWLEAPDKSLPFWSRQTLLTRSGRAEYFWTPAFEDAPGEWVLHIRRLAGGEEITKRLSLTR